MKPNWVCTKCGMYSSRKSSVKRHIQLVHQGLGTCVSYTDYLAGRTSGRYESGSSPDFGSKDSLEYKKMEAFFVGLYDELGREAAHMITRPPLKLPSLGGYMPRNPFAEGMEIFGIVAYVCPNCFVTKPLMIYYGSGMGGGHIERLYCPPAAKKDISTVTSNPEWFLEARRKTFPSYLATCIDAWTKEVKLLAIKADDPVREGKVTLILHGSKNPSSVSIPYTEEQRIRLDPKITGEWAMRAINTESTILSKPELTEFLNKTIDATYGFFQITGDKSDTVYLMAVTKGDSQMPIRVVDKEVQMPESLDRKNNVLEIPKTQSQENI